MSNPPPSLLEYSVVYTERSLNHMSSSFQSVMQDISKHLRSVYNAESIAIVPGGGTYGMESVARAFATGKKCLVLRNGWFSYRWTQIFQSCQIPSEEIVLRASALDDTTQSAFAPVSIEDVISIIQKEKPDIVFAPHVETSAGILLPDEYIAHVSEVVHAYGGMFVLDCIASGALWVDMKALGVDILITAPQKGWSSSPCAAVVLMGNTATERLPDTQSTSFANDLKRWREIMSAYEEGRHAYHATMPTDALFQFRNTIVEAQQFGFDNLKRAQQTLGCRIRELLEDYGYKSVAASGFMASSVVVSYTTDPRVQNGRAFMERGMQIAGGVPLACDEKQPFQTFRIGLFGLDKLSNIEKTVADFQAVVHQIQDCT